VDFQPGTYPVDRIISLLRSGRLALPEFQRDFVWSPAKVVELLDSVSRGWPVGSLLLLRGPQPFEAKSIDQAPSLRGDVDVFVLDGQQRITALYHALANVSDVCYYVDFKVLAEGGQEYILWKRRVQFEREAGTAKERARRRIALINEVADNELFFAWQSNLSGEVAREVLSLREQHLSGLKSKVYRLPVVELEHEIELEALARIFETINRTGVKLNAFDLMVAVLCPHDFKLRDAWEDALLEYPLLKVFEVDGIEILKLVALWTRRKQQEERVRVTVRGVRQGDVLAIPPPEVKSNWKRALLAYVEALRLLVGRLGVAHPSLAPPPAMMLAIAAFMDGELETTLPTDLVLDWYWSSVRTQSYSQGANTRVVADVDRAARSSSQNVSGSLTIEDFGASLFEPVRRNRILLNGLGSALVIHGARDIKTGQLLSGAGEGPIVARSLISIAKGDARPDENAAVVSNVFAREDSFREIAAEVRRGAPLEKVCDSGAFASQFVDHASLYGDFKSRARSLSRLLLEGST
jgi:hypothetical protein